MMPARWLSLVIFVVACGRSTTDATPSVSLAVSPASLLLVAIGQHEQLKATVTSSDGAPVSGRAVSWSSTAPAVATVDASGVVTAVANGETTVRAVTGGASGEIAITVRQRARSVSITPSSVEITGIGSAVNVEVVARDSLLQPIAAPQVQWRSLNPNVADVAAQDVRTARVTGTRSGQATVEARVEGVPGYTLMTVSSPDPGIALTWSRAALGLTGQGLYGVWGSSASDVWAVGWNGTILHFNGTAWSSVSPTPTHNALRAVWGTAPNDIWAVGVSSTILHYDGASWRDASPGFSTDRSFLGVWGSAPNDVWAVGDFGSLAHYDGSSWRDVGTGQNLWAVWGSSANDVWAVGLSGTIRHYDGTAWNDVQIPGLFLNLFGVWATGARDVWAVGDIGTLFSRYSGDSWQLTTITASGASMLAIWGSRADDVWAVGQGGVILHATNKSSSSNRSRTAKQ